MVKKILSSAMVLVILLVSFFALQRLLVPKYQTALVEGSLISDYYGEKTKKHDVIFIGDCEVYENFSPVTLWRENGITSYIRGSASQTIWQSYYLLEDTLRYETPRVVVFNVLAMQYGEPVSEPYNRLNLDGMALSLSKIRSVRASMTEDETLASYLFPILRYHDRWSELTQEDIRYFAADRNLSHNGFLMRADVRPMGALPSVQPLADYSFAEVCWEYLERMRALCAQEGIELVLVKAPSMYPHWYDEWDRAITDYADANGLRYYNFLDMTQEIGIDMQTDTYDHGLHLNLFGAEKLSRFFGGLLNRELGLSGHQDDAALWAYWEEKAAQYDAMLAHQLEELETYGYLKSYGAKPPEATS